MVNSLSQESSRMDGRKKKKRGFKRYVEGKLGKA